MISIGIDISKEKSTVSMLRPFGEVVMSPFEFQHNEHDLNNLVKKIRSFKEETKVVLEATGGYHLVVVASLRVFMATLRKKIEATPDSPQYIQTHIGVGYRMMRVE